MITNSLVVSCLDYCNRLFFGAKESILKQLQLIQNSASKAITGKYKHDHLGDDIRKLHWLNNRQWIVFKIALLAYKAINGQAPQYLQDMFRFCHHGNSVKLIIPFPLTKYGSRSFNVIGPKIFNNLPLHFTSNIIIKAFKSCLKTFLCNLTDVDLEELYC